MWVALDTWLLADQRVPEVGVGESVLLQLGLVAITAHPYLSPDNQAVPYDAITPMPRSAAHRCDPRHRVRGMLAAAGESVLIHAGGQSIQVNEAPGLPGQLVDVIGDLTVTDGPARSKSTWNVQDIVLHYAPIVVADEATVFPAPPGTAVSIGVRTMTAAQYLHHAGTERAKASGIDLPGSRVDYEQGEYVTVAQAWKFPAKHKGFRCRYLVDIAPKQP